MKIDTTSDYHMHSIFSDGNASINEIALSAIQKGLSQITITDHMPLPFDTRYAMGRDRLDQYKLAIKKAQSIYSDQLKINMGIEIEFDPELESWIQSILQMGWEYSIASVHRLSIKNTSHMVNGTKTEFDDLFQGFDYNIQALYQAYYETVQTALNTGWFSIAGHLDVLKKNNTDNQYFNASDPHYKSLVMDTLDIIKKQNMKMEVNMSGLNHPVKEQYPSRWIIHEAIKKGIPVILSSDSHSLKTIGQYFYKIDDLIEDKVTAMI